MPQISLERAQRMMQKSKRIAKRKRARNRTKQKNKKNANNAKNAKAAKAAKQSVDKVSISPQACEEQHPGFNQLSEKEKKKVMQSVRNRISAQESRDKKKAYIKSLETNSVQMTEENLALKQ